MDKLNLRDKQLNIQLQVSVLINNLHLATYPSKSGETYVKPTTETYV